LVRGGNAWLFGSLPEPAGRVGGGFFTVLQEVYLLRPEFVGKIGAKFLGFLQESAREKYQLNRQIQPSVLQILTQKMEQGDNLLFGGRRRKTLLETLIERPLNSWIFQQENGGEKLAGKTLEVGLNHNVNLVCRVV